MRKTSQYIIPAEKPEAVPGNYSIYPSHNLAEGKIKTGFESLAGELAKHSLVILEGYQGVFFEDIRDQLDSFFKLMGKRVKWMDIREAMKTEEEISALIEPFLGGNDPLFGTRTTLRLADFFDPVKLQQIHPDALFDLNIIYGPGAALLQSPGFLVYFDLPKNELQYRARAASITNLGASEATDIKSMYKRFFFVDWVVLNRHKQEMPDQIDIVADAQRAGEISWAHGHDIREALHFLSRNVFRVRPWFEPGAWGGTWCLRNIEGLNKDVPNYAWSFELIVPENGIIFESSGKMLEVSFDMLMFQEAVAIQGEAFEQFGYEFPIRFDFLDTFNGGNLSVQCHPQLEYIKEHFNESFTQEETYYILDTQENACVYLGFQDDIDPGCFERSLNESFLGMKELEIEKFVRKLPARKHDFFLIPPGTIHASGKNNLVLEISSTPYIYTFKMYDWVRPDLDGKPRPLNITRAMANLCFYRKGDYVVEKLISKPELIEKGDGWELYHLPTHNKHFYDVHRIHLKTEIYIPTKNKFMVINLVKGSSIIIETESGHRAQFNYAETFVVPAAAGSFRIINQDPVEAMIVKAFIK